MEKKKLLLSLSGVALLIVATIGVSLAAYTFSNTGASNVNSIQTGSIAMNYTESSNTINITDAIPVNDTTGKNQTL